METCDVDLNKTLQQIGMSEDDRKGYNRIREGSMNKVLEVMKEDTRFRQVFRNIHFTGSHYDKLKVGNRQEYDLNIIYRSPKDIRISEGKADSPHFMKLETSTDEAAFDCIRDGNLINPQKAFQVLQQSGDRALSKLNNIAMVDNTKVKITRSVGNPYTLRIQASNGKYKDRIEVDLVPALELPVSLLPRGVSGRIQEVQDRFNVKEDKCLAVALPVVKKDTFQIDFPHLARSLMEEKPALKSAIRLIKHERDQKGGPFTKIWSHAVKMAGLWELEMNSNPESWSNDKLEARFQGIRNRIKNSLLMNDLQDFFFPSLNMMKRIKSSSLKNNVGVYLSKTSQAVEESGKKVLCPLQLCNRQFKKESHANQHAAAKHRIKGNSTGQDASKTSNQSEHSIGASGNPARVVPCALGVSGNPGRVVPCGLGLCGKGFYNLHGAALHAVDSHRSVADQTDFWRSYLKSQGKIPCGFCACPGGKVRGFSNNFGYGLHCKAMQH